MKQFFNPPFPPVIEDFEDIELGTVDEGFLFTTSQNYTGKRSYANYFANSSADVYPLSNYTVYVNGSETTLNYRALQYSARDQIRILAKEGVTKYPAFYGKSSPSLLSVDAPFPKMADNAGNDLTSVNQVFYEHTSLSSLPNELFKNNRGITDFSYCFRKCSALKSVPSDIFKYNINATTFDHCFMETYMLSVPSDLFKYNTRVTSFNYTFGYCNIQNIPQDLFRYNTKVTDFGFCFTNGALTSIPGDIFKYNPEVTNFEYCFFDNSEITIIPSELFKYNKKANNFKHCFHIYRTNSTPKLTLIPSDLFSNAPSNSYFDYCFALQNRYTGALPELWISHPRASHDHCFYNCSNASNYANAQAAGWVS